MWANKNSAGSERKGLKACVWKLWRRFRRGGEEEEEGRTNYEDQVNNIKSERASLSLFFEEKNEGTKRKRDQEEEEDRRTGEREYESAETQVEKPFQTLIFLLFFTLYERIAFSKSCFPKKMFVRSFLYYTYFSFASHTVAYSLLPIAIIIKAQE